MEARVSHWEVRRLRTDKRRRREFWMRMTRVSQRELVVVVEKELDFSETEEVSRSVLVS